MPANLAAQPTVAIGNGQATVTFAGRTSAGLDQINVVVPALPAGTQGVVDLPISAKAGQATSQPGLLVTVQSGN